MRVEGSGFQGAGFEGWTAGHESCSMRGTYPRRLPAQSACVGVRFLMSEVPLCLETPWSFIVDLSLEPHLELVVGLRVWGSGV